MIWIQRTVCLLVSATLILLGFYFQRNIPTIGATGEGVNLGGNLYPTDLVLWIMWLVNITVAGFFLIYATKPR